MTARLERRLAAIEAKRRHTDVKNLSDEELDRRIRELEELLLQHYTPAELRDAYRAMGVSESLLQLMDE